MKTAEMHVGEETNSQGVRKLFNGRILVFTVQELESYTRMVQIDAGGRADDWEAIDKEWLIRIAGVELAGDVLCADVKPLFEIGEIKYGETWRATIVTRKDFRDLARLLRVKLKELL